ncbi:MAG: hypothetical protein CTY16_12100 [Methylobacter sp.]|nr:MAG: hypothetical protein CTY16_12100 [Methylobacter sp.]
MGFPFAGQPTAGAMFTVGTKDGWGGGNCGWLPTPAESGNCATSPHAAKAIAMSVDKQSFSWKAIIKKS